MKDDQLTDLVHRERRRLRNFIRRRVADPRGLFRVARNGGLGSGGGNRSKDLTPEERERFRQRMRDQYCDTPESHELQVPPDHSRSHEKPNA